MGVALVLPRIDRVAELHGDEDRDGAALFDAAPDTEKDGVVVTSASVPDGLVVPVTVAHALWLAECVGVPAARDGESENVADSMAVAEGDRVAARTEPDGLDVVLDDRDVDLLMDGDVVTVGDRESVALTVDSKRVPVGVVVELPDAVAHCDDEGDGELDGLDDALALGDSVPVPVEQTDVDADDVGLVVALPVVVTDVLGDADDDGVDELESVGESDADTEPDAEGEADVDVLVRADALALAVTIATVADEDGDGLTSPLPVIVGLDAADVDWRLLRVGVELREDETVVVIVLDPTADLLDDTVTLGEGDGEPEKVMLAVSDGALCDASGERDAEGDADADGERDDDGDVDGDGDMVDDGDEDADQPLERDGVLVGDGDGVELRDAATVALAVDVRDTETDAVAVELARVLVLVLTDALPDSSLLPVCDTLALAQALSRALRLGASVGQRETAGERETPIVREPVVETVTLRATLDVDDSVELRLLDVVAELDTDGDEDGDGEALGDDDELGDARAERLTRIETLELLLGRTDALLDGDAEMLGVPVGDRVETAVMRTVAVVNRDGEDERDLPGDPDEPPVGEKRGDTEPLPDTEELCVTLGEPTALAETDTEGVGVAVALGQPDTLGDTDTDDETLDETETRTVMLGERDSAADRDELGEIDVERLGAGLRDSVCTTVAPEDTDSETPGARLPEGCAVDVVESDGDGDTDGDAVEDGLKVDDGDVAGERVSERVALPDRDTLTDAEDKPDPDDEPVSETLGVSDREADDERVVAGEAVGETVPEARGLAERLRVTDTVAVDDGVGDVHTDGERDATGVREMDATCVRVGVAAREAVEQAEFEELREALPDVDPQPVADSVPLAELDMDPDGDSDALGDGDVEDEPEAEKEADGVADELEDTLAVTDALNVDVRVDDGERVDRDEALELTVDEFERRAEGDLKVERVLDAQRDAFAEIVRRAELLVVAVEDAVPVEERVPVAVALDERVAEPDAVDELDAVADAVADADADAETEVDVEGVSACSARAAARAAPSRGRLAAVEQRRRNKSRGIASGWY